jgi:PAB1-binding protein PBP1
MIRKIVICAIIALILVPASVMAAGFGGKNAGTAPAQGQCLQDGQNCENPSGTPGTGMQAQYRHGGQQNGEARGHGSLNGACTSEQKQTRSMLRLQNQTCTGCQGIPAVQS